VPTSPRVPDCPVDAITRRDGNLSVLLTVVHEPGFNNVGPQKLVGANPYRLRVTLYAPVSNSGLVWWGGQNLQWQANTIVNGFEMEPGTGWEIDDYTGPIWVFAWVGSGDQGVKWTELTDTIAKAAGF
jgi:hypothetical protein